MSDLPRKPISALPNEDDTIPAKAAGILAEKCGAKK